MNLTENKVDYTGGENEIQDYLIWRRRLYTDVTPQTSMHRTLLKQTRQVHPTLRAKPLDR